MSVPGSRIGFGELLSLIQSGLQPLLVPGLHSTGGGRWGWKVSLWAQWVKGSWPHWELLRVWLAGPGGGGPWQVGAGTSLAHGFLDPQARLWPTLGHVTRRWAGQLLPGGQCSAARLWAVMTNIHCTSVYLSSALSAFNPCSNSRSRTLLGTPFYRWGKQCTERFSNLSKVTQPAGLESD